MPYANVAIQTEEVELLLPNIDESAKIYASRKFNLPPDKVESQLPTSLYSLNILKSNKDGWMSRITRKWICMLLFIIGFIWLGMLYFEHYCAASKSLCALTPLRNLSKFRYTDVPEKHLGLSKIRYTDIPGKPLSHSYRRVNIPSFDDVVSKDFQFDIEGHDVMVFLHIQKTGGTSFGRHLVKDLELQRECVCHRKIKKRCTCLRPGPNSKETWLFSRYSTGWKCGLHADWTELTSCVDEAMDKIDDSSVNRRYFYITYLREPVHRYLSEYRHVRRGATWKNARLYCQGHSATKEEVPPCYKGEDWSGVAVKEFLSCSSNLANNRQTRMLADLSLVDCYNTATMTPQERDTILLASAKRNLHQMAFFGLTEFQEISQYVFEETFNLKFNVRFEQYNQTTAGMTEKNIDQDIMQAVGITNHLDLQLYEYGKELLMNRFNILKNMDPKFEDHFKNMGHMRFSWDDVDKEN